MAGSAAHMRPKESVKRIGEALAALCSTGPDGVFETTRFRLPELFLPNPGRPSAVVRWDGVIKDDWPRYQEKPVPYKSPSDLRYAVGIYHPQIIPAEEVTPAMDAYEYAQMKVEEGYDDFYVNMRADRRLGGLLDEIVMTGGVMFDLPEPRTGERFWYMETIVVATLY